MSMFDFLKKKEKAVETPKVVETPKPVEPIKVEEPKMVVVKESAKVIEPKKTKATKPKTMKVPIDPLLEKCNKAIVKEIAKDHHEEAKEILQLSSEETRREFLSYHEKDQGNICCLVLDKAKRDLIAEGKLKYNPEAAFGHPFML
jgi:hypothetical protein